MVILASAPLNDCSRILRDECNTKRYRLHRQKLRDVKSTIDTKSPRHPSSNGFNPRGRRLKAERQCEIYKENCLLIRNLLKIQTDRNTSIPKKTKGKGIASRNAINQRKEMEQIVAENQARAILLLLIVTNCTHNSTRPHRGSWRASIIPSMLTQTPSTTTMLAT
jgi:hypothetical protein